MATQQARKRHVRRRISQVLKKVEQQLMDGQLLPYFEPFCGGCSVLQYFLGSGDRLIYASDINPDLIFMWKVIQNTPIQVHNNCSTNQCEFSHSLDGSCFLSTLSKRLTEVSENIKRVSFDGPCSYEEYEPEGMLVYCNPPMNEMPSDDQFWKTMRKWNENNLVFIADKSAPGDFIKIWEDLPDKLYIHKELASLIPKKTRDEIRTY
jgi:site-specific DNA-adenine methylase